MTSSKWQKRTYSIQVLIGVLLAIGILYAAKVVVIPLVVAMLLTFILTPIVFLLQRWGIPRVFSVIITVLFVLFLFGTAGYIVGLQVHTLAGELPKHRTEIEAKIASLRQGGGTFADLFEMFREIKNAEVKDEPSKSSVPVQEKEVIIARPVEGSSSARIFEALTPVLEPIVHAVFIVILVMFMLFHREDFRNRFIGLLGDGRLTGTTRVIVDSAHRISQYLLTLSLINLTFGVLFSIGLYLIGVDYAILWGFVTVMMRFVPYIGTWISVALPFTFSFATAPSWAQPITLIVYFGVLELITANVVEPLLLGHRTGVSPIALLVAAAFWTWLWGPMGLVLSTPMTVCMVVLGQHVPQLRFFAILLGDQPPLPPGVRYYQRLVARDADEAKEVALTYATAKGADQVYDDVLLPALIMARKDHQEAGLEADDLEFIIQSTREVLDHKKLTEPLPSKEVAEAAAAAEAAVLSTQGSVPSAEPVLEKSRILILGCPAHQQVEELALQMLKNLMKQDNCDVEIVSTRVLPVEIETRIVASSPSLVFIAVLPPGGLVQARYLCRRLRKRFGDLPIIVGYWGETGDFDKLFRQVRSAGGNYVATSLLHARSQINKIVNPEVVTEPQQGGAA